ncbi:MAG TPA: GTP-binding protein [Rhodopila sp.]
MLTGFRGSGKTTLLRAALASPDLADAVIINEAARDGTRPSSGRGVADQILGSICR